MKAARSSRVRTILLDPKKRDEVARKLILGDKPSRGGKAKFKYGDKTYKIVSHKKSK